MTRHTWIRRLFSPRPAAARKPARRPHLGFDTFEDRIVPAGGFNGAIYTSKWDGTTVNANIYDNKADVYINGGPQNQNAAGLPDGTYFFQVTDPSGATLLSQDSAWARQLVVVNGRVYGVPPAGGAANQPAGTYHATGSLNTDNSTIPVQLLPYADTPNNGGEYKAWLIRQTSTTVVQPDNPNTPEDESRFISFSSNDAKTDNFKVRSDVVVPSSTYGGFKFNDLNGDGIWDEGEPPIEGWTIEVRDEIGTLIDTTTTSATGFWSYTFSSEDGFELGDKYSFNELQAEGWTQTFDGGDTVTLFLPHGDMNFGNFKNIEISGLKYTDTNGDGSLDGDSPGTPGQTFTIDLYEWTDAGDLDGQVQDDELTYVDSTETDADTGAYSFADLGPLAAGTQYYVREAGETGWTQTYGNDGYTTVATSGGDDPGNNFGNFQNITISGYKWNDLNGDGMWDADEPGYEGWTIYLNGGDSVLTDANGYYEFTNLGPGSYEITEADGGADWTNTFDGSTTVEAISGTDVGGGFEETEVLNFGNFKNIDLSGYKWLDANGNGAWDQGESGYVGWKIYLDDNTDPTDGYIACTTTGAGGYYSFDNITPAQINGADKLHVYEKDLSPDWTQTYGGYCVDATSGQVVAGTSGVAETGNFGNFENIDLSGYKWLDANGNGAWDQGESGYVGWKIYLDNDNNPGNGYIACATTGAGGYYSFTNVTPAQINGATKLYVYEDQTAILTGLWVQTYGGYCVDATSGQVVAGTSGVAETGNFGNQYKGLETGDTATIGFWQNPNGQALIKALNGGPSATNLGNWLASCFPYLYGVNAGSNNLAGKTNTEVAAKFVQFFSVRGQKTDAQILGTALAVYVTNSTLAGTTAVAYGFNVSTTGTGAKLYNVGSNGTAIGLSNNTAYTVMKLLKQANLKKQSGPFNANAFNSIFDGINNLGDRL